MRYVILFLPVFAAAMLLEILVAPLFSGMGGAAARPDLVLVALCLAALNLPERQAVLCGLAAGLLLDSFSGGAFGTCSAAYAAAAFVASRARRSIAHDGIFTQILVVFALSGFVEALCLTRLSVLSPSFDERAAAVTVFLDAILSALAAPVFFQVRRSVFEKIGLLPPSKPVIAIG